MHFILHVSVWWHQEFHVNPACMHGYGLCCRMSNPTPDDDTTSGSNIVNPPHAGRQGPVTRQRSTVSAMAQAAAATPAAAAQAAEATPAPAASQGAQSVAATIDYHSLATAMSRLNDDSASNLERALSPSGTLRLRHLLTSSIRLRYGQIRMISDICLSILLWLLQAICISMK